MSTRILGLSAFYHDSAAALIVDGEIVAAAQEERFTRKKHDATFPQHAIDYCLREAGKLTFAADRALKKRLKATLRSVLARLRRRIQALPDTDLFRPILLDYTAALRSTARASQPVSTAAPCRWVIARSSSRSW